MEPPTFLLLGAGAAVAAVAARPRATSAPAGTRLVAAPAVPALDVRELAPPYVAERLRRAGVRTARDLLETDQVEGVDEPALRNARRLARLVAIPNVGRDEAALLAACGVEAPEDLLAVPPAALAERLGEANARLAVVEGRITVGEVRQWAESVHGGLAQPSIAVPGEQPSGVA